MIKLVYKDGHEEYLSISTTEFEETYELYMTEDVDYAVDYNHPDYN